jgi:type I restriction enzyme M protein
MAKKVVEPGPKAAAAAAPNAPGSSRSEDIDADIAFERQLFQAADKLRNNMDAAEYKHVVLGLIFLKYISDSFEAKRKELLVAQASGADPEDPDEYRAENVFWVPKEARWASLLASAKDPAIGKILDDAMVAIERDNSSLKGVLPKEYARPGLDKQRLGELIDLIGGIPFTDPLHKERDLLGRVYEYFLSEFASAEGKRGGQFYTPRPVVKLLVEMLAPYKGRIYDPCCGSAGMFVQSAEFIKAHASENGNGTKAKGDIAIYGQESNYTTWRLAKMNLAIRGIDAKITHGDSFHNDQHVGLQADYVIANPPFNDSDWKGEQLADDKRWKFGVPPPGNANFAWVQHFISKLSPTGLAGFVLANGSMSSAQSGEGEIRQQIIEADLVDCMVALPGQLFYSTQIPVCLWFLARDKKNGRFRDRCGQVLFIDARRMGTMISRVQRALTAQDITTIATTYQSWRGDKDCKKSYADAPGFCKSASIEEIKAHNFVLTPGRYVGAEEATDDGEPFEQKMTRFTGELVSLTARGSELDQKIATNLASLGFALPSGRAKK